MVARLESPGIGSDQLRWVQLLYPGLGVLNSVRELPMNFAGRFDRGLFAHQAPIDEVPPVLAAGSQPGSSENTGGHKGDVLARYSE
jgi:hypothetical protein